MALNPNIDLSQTVARKAQQETSEDHPIVAETNGGENLPGDQPRLHEYKSIISIYENLDRAEQENRARSWAKRSIYRIPHYLKDGKEEAYVPQIVSLGPYHHGDEHLREKDKDKWRGLACMLRRNNQKIDDYLYAVKQVEERARACYKGAITMSSEEFILMMVLDGCFMIEFFWGCSKGFDKLGYIPDDPIFSLSRNLIVRIQRDMILLENQIPLFILDLLFCLQLGQPDHDGLLAKLVLQFFYSLKPTNCPLNCLGRKRLEFDPLPHEGELHCLELIRRSLLYPGLKPVATQQSSQTRLQVIHCVTELRKKGIKFRKGEVAATQQSSQTRLQVIHCVTELRKKGIKFRKGEVEGFWNIQFKDGTLEVPRLVIHDATRVLFLNSIAFEKLHFNCGYDVTSYVRFMDNLINSAEDVGHLRDCGIVQPWRGSNAKVADLFNQLGKEVIFDFHDGYLSKLFEDVNNYSGNKWNSWIASLKLIFQGIY